MDYKKISLDRNLKAQKELKKLFESYGIQALLIYIDHWCIQELRTIEKDKYQRIKDLNETITLLKAINFPL